ncbi:V-type ATPase 116kDa subunit family protein [uncultured archaeon]|nr:V-type ATPase 116kDa subunit family protein [uncultured archaeon]
MFFPEKMCKVRVIERKASLRKAIDCLESFGGAEIKRFSSEEIGNCPALEGLQAGNERLVRLDAILSGMKGNGQRQKLTRKEAAEFLKSGEARQAEERAIAIGIELEKLQSEIDSAKEDIARVREFSSFGIDFGKIQSGSIEIIAGTVQKKDEAKFEKALGQEGVLKHTQKPSMKNSGMHLVAVLKGDEATIHGLSTAGLERMPMPKINGTPQAEIKDAEKRIASLQGKIGALSKELAKAGERHRAQFAAAREHLSIEAEKAAAPQNFGSTGHSFVLEAYLPEKNYGEFERAARERIGEKVFIQKFSSSHLARHHEEAPTLLSHHPLLEPFEWLTKFMSVPKGSEIDPTVIFLIFFPVFYGMMVGDFIYGIISFLIARWLMQKFPPGGIMNPVAKMWMWSAIPTIIFGVIFDEYAGMSHMHLLEKFGLHGIELYTGIERLTNINLLLTVTILAGVFTMALGFLLGFVNAMKHGEKKHAIAKLGWFGIVTFGTLVVSTAMFKALPEVVLLPSAAMFVVSLIAMVKQEGVMGLIELPGVMGNVLSFARILAVGLSGTVIALILNDMAFPSPDKGLMALVLLPLFIFGHVFNAFLAMFESFIQGARLNYVEFYSKFFEGGGKEFTPFKFERKYLKD